MKYDLIIIGAGPAGFFAGIFVKDNTRILMLNSAPKPLLKLLASGAGACNFTHNGTHKEFLENYPEGKIFFRNQYYNYDNNSLIKFFKNHGIETIMREDGKFFPKSMDAREIQNLLLNLFLEKGRLINNCRVENISFNKDSGFFKVGTNSKNFYGKNILLATGGKSYPSTGSDGSGFNLASTLGHKINPLKPALSSVNIKNHFLSLASGLSFENINIYFLQNNKKVQASGALIITHKGLSGPVIIDNSHLFEAGQKLVLNFLGTSYEQAIEKIKEDKSLHANKQFSNLPIFNVLSQKIIEACISSLGYNFFTKKSADINLQEIKLAAKLLTQLELEISSIDGWNKAMATSGGIPTKEINPKTMKSLVQPNLFFAGEVIDILGKTGGYNIQAAYSTARTFAENFSSD